MENDTMVSLIVILLAAAQASCEANDTTMDIAQPPLHMTKARVSVRLQPFDQGQILLYTPEKPEAKLPCCKSSEEALEFEVPSQRLCLRGTPNATVKFDIE